MADQNGLRVKDFEQFLLDVLQCCCYIGEHLLGNTRVSALVSMDKNRRRGNLLCKIIGDRLFRLDKLIQDY
jgi:hypothetical protein